MCIPLCFMADSPMAAEVTNTPHPGKANNPCRICHLRVDYAKDKHEMKFIQDFFGYPTLPNQRHWSKTISDTHQLWKIHQKTSEKESDDEDFDTYQKACGINDTLLNELIEMESKSAPERIRIKQISRDNESQLFNPFLKLESFDGCQDTPVKFCMYSCWV